LLLLATAPLSARAAQQPAERAAPAQANEADIVCRTVDRPGSHMKQRICAKAADWLAARDRVVLLKTTPVAAALPTGDSNLTTAPSGYSFQR